MSDVITEGTMIQCRVLRRWSSYMLGDEIALPIPEARELAARRLVVPYGMLVPVKASDDDAPPAATPRGPAGQFVRK
jgi:hypothetical protein